MDPKDHILSFPPEYQPLWRETERHAMTLRTWAEYSVQGDEWVYIGILKRAAELVTAISQLLAVKNFSASTVLDRVLLELKFRASWLSEDADRKRLAEFASMVESEYSVLIRKMKEGRSLSAQILNHLFGDHAVETAKRDGQARSSVFRLAEEADLAFDYDIPYWTESLYVHSHPLSMSMYRPKAASRGAPFADALVEVASGQAIPFQLFGGVPSTFAWILDYISMCYDHPVAKDGIKELREAVNTAMNTVTGGMWTTSGDVPQGSLSVFTDEGKTTFQRKQSRA